MVRGKRHPDSREKRAATRLPRGAQRFASLPGSLQALTHQSSLPPPVRATPPVDSAPAAHIPLSTLQLPAGLPAHPLSLLSRSPSFIAYPLAIPSQRNLPFSTLPPRNNAANRAGRRTPSSYALVTLPFFATRQAEKVCNFFFNNFLIILRMRITISGCV